jgi:hypothetical protein
LISLTPAITGSKKQSEAALFTVRVNGIVMCHTLLSKINYCTSKTKHQTYIDTFSDLSPNKTQYLTRQHLAKGRPSGIEYFLQEKQHFFSVSS